MTSDTPHLVMLHIFLNIQHMGNSGLAVNVLINISICCKIDVSSTYSAMAFQHISMLTACKLDSIFGPF